MQTIETTVAALFIHGDRSSRPEDHTFTPMLALEQIDAIEGWGVRQDPRYFHRPIEGQDRKRQVSLIDEGTIERHEKSFGPIPRNAVKSQIVLAGVVPLPELIGATLVFDSGAELTISIKREPCFAMDFIADGLRLAMRDGHQGALARVTAGGTIRVHAPVTIIPAPLAVR